MTVNELYKYAYVKRPLAELYKDISSVPEEFIIEWLKETHDYIRLHSDDELREFLTLSPEDVLNWLDEAVPFVWEAKRESLKKGKPVIY